MSTVTVSKEVAEAIEYLQKDVEYGFSEFMRVKSQSGWTTSKASPLNKVEIKTLASALINGYQVEKSPEEQVREFYDKCRTNSEIAYEQGEYRQSEYLNGQVNGISLTLQMLGIKIKGVNS